MAQSVLRDANRRQRLSSTAVALSCCNLGENSRVYAAVQQEQPETYWGQSIFRELQMIHEHIRRDLEAVQRLATRVLNEISPEELQAEIAHLKNKGPLWLLRTTCLRYCRFVHLHHHIEDEAFFPALRREDPALSPVIAKLEEDHRVVSRLLDAIEEGAKQLTQLDSHAVRRNVADALRTLTQHLLVHLDFEEASIGPTLRRLNGF